MPEDFRPDLIGVMFHFQELDLGPRRVHVMHAWEMRPAALEQPAIARMIQEHEDKGFVILRRRAKDERTYGTSASMSRTLFTQSEAMALFEQLKAPNLATKMK